MKTGKQAHTTEDAWASQKTYKDVPHGWIQWKGTEVCMDVHCKCGALAHVDASFAYHVRCEACDTVYFCNSHIELIELLLPPESMVVMAAVD